METYKIQTDEEYHKLLDAVRMYHKKVLARRENLAGTYWKETIYNVKDTPEHGDVHGSTSWMFVSKVSGETSELKITKFKDEVWINTHANVLYIDVLENDKQKTEYITQERFIKETAPLLAKYRLYWK